jgi:hypothetical protein
VGLADREDVRDAAREIEADAAGDAEATHGRVPRGVGCVARQRSNQRQQLRLAGARRRAEQHGGCGRVHANGVAVVRSRADVDAGVSLVGLEQDVVPAGRAGDGRGPHPALDQLPQPAAGGGERPRRRHAHKRDDVDEHLLRQRGQWVADLPRRLHRRNRLRHSSIGRPHSLTKQPGVLACDEAR